MGMMMVRVGDGDDKVVGDDVDGGCDDGVVLARQVAAACGSGDECDEGGVEMVVLDFSIGFGFFAIPKDVAPTTPVLRRSSKVSQQP
ncbi:hypothetical protein Tco_0716988, partial [Tanacetum coccineum]